MGKTITKLGLMCLAQGHNAVATHGHSVSSQALYHQSESQSLNPENKLLYEMKKIQLLFSCNNVFIFNFSKMCNNKAV